MSPKRKDNGLTKVCKECNIEKPLSEFFFWAKRNWYSPRCKPCHNIFCTKYRHSEKGKATSKTWSKSDRGSEVTKQRMATWRAKNKIKRTAQTAVSNAIRDGRLQRGSCIICNVPMAEAHHNDYSKPFQITWLCKTHHSAIHYHPIPPLQAK
jgi:hypothetical protein